MEENRTLVAVGRNVFVATVSWPALCSLSQQWCNAQEEAQKQFRDDCLYMGRESMGNREWETEKSSYVEGIQGQCNFDHWCGYREEGSRRFFWGSAMSGATLEAVRQLDGTWRLTFTGCDTSTRPESGYVASFADAADMSTLEIVQLVNPEAILEVLQIDLVTSEARLAQLNAFVSRLVPGSILVMPPKGTSVPEPIDQGTFGDGLTVTFARRSGRRPRGSAPEQSVQPKEHAEEESADDDEESLMGAPERW